MAYPKDELPAPAAVHDDPRAFELLRLWFAEGSPQLSARLELWPDPAAWGVMLADIAARLADEIAALGEVDRDTALARIQAGWVAEVEGATAHPPGARGEVLPYAHFVEAVLRQLTRSPGAGAEGAGHDDEAAALASVMLALEGAAAGERTPQFQAALAHLGGSPRLVSILYQNLDLLPPDDAISHGMALLIGAILEAPAPPDAPPRS